MQPLITFQKLISYQFKDARLLTQALTHKSYAFENNKGADVNSYNERLEFLGDAVLDLAISEILMKETGATEGELSRRRAALVNERTLAAVARKLGLAEFIILGKGEASSQGANKESILASTLEAVVGAVFIDGGFTEARSILENRFSSYLKGITEICEFMNDHKTKLQEKWQAENKAAPCYKLDKAEGPDHQKVFFVSVYINETKLAEGSGKSRKEAEQNAAANALGKELKS